MVFFNYATMQMAAKIVYYGPGLCGKTTNLRYIYEKTSPQSRGEMVSLETETDRTLFFDLLPLDVGVIGGFKTRLQLYTVPGQVFYNTTRKLVLKGVDGIVFVADSQRAMVDADVEQLSEPSRESHGDRPGARRDSSGHPAQQTRSAERGRRGGDRLPDRPRGNVRSRPGVGDDRRGHLRDAEGDLEAHAPDAPEADDGGRGAARGGAGGAARRVPRSRGASPAAARDDPAAGADRSAGRAAGALSRSARAGRSGAGGGHARRDGARRAGADGIAARRSRWSIT